MAGTKEVSGECRFSIVIAVLGEEQRINHLLEHTTRTQQGHSYEIIVVDGHPGAGTIKAIEREDVKKVVAERGRARQMNAGAEIAKGKILVFLHADTELPGGGLSRIAEVLGDESCVGGAFALGIDSERLSLRIIAAVARLRCRLTRIAYGDQAIFIWREYFERIGGFKEIPLMEDVELMRRIKRRGDKICILRERVKTSSRRWERDGVIYTTLRNIMLLSLYLLGVSPQMLARYYRSGHDGTER